MTLIEELHAVPTFDGLPDEAIEWLAGHMQVVELEAGQIHRTEGSPADHMVVLLEGEMRARHEASGDDGRMFVWRHGQVSGLLPYSRLKVYPLTTRAVAHSRVALLHKDHFSEMLERFPVLGNRLVGVMSDRIRDNARAELHTVKLAMLGKIAAGLAHELNNPAAAALRAAKSLQDSVIALRTSNLRLDRLALSAEQRLALSDMEEHCLKSPPGANADPLERSDREQTLGEWFQDHGMDDGWSLAASLADCGFGVESAERIAQGFPVEAIAAIVRRIEASLSLGRLVNDIENSTGRISELVKAVKDYSYVDQGTEQDVDVHSGLESTLLILRHKLKRGISVVREYDRTLPKIRARGGELNQVWTNLIVNAVEAMHEAGELRIRTSRDGSCLLVEIIDSGPGIPPEVQARLFEPFFTTKPPGEGTGLGLETSQRIIENHHGDISFETRPGETNFKVRLPLARII